MGLDFEYIDGQTPLDEEEKTGLLIPSVTIRAELDEFEQLNIQKAVEWTILRKFKVEKILSEEFLLELHKRMYGDVWNWAGCFRKSDRNIGVSYFKIAVELKVLLEDARYWLEKETYAADEFAVRFKHRVVAIHCFPNGNGRHSRLIADIIISQIFGGEVYSWGSSALLKADGLRKSYISSLRLADKGEIGPLVEFARS